MSSLLPINAIGRRLLVGPVGRVFENPVDQELEYTQYSCEDLSMWTRLFLGFFFSLTLAPQGSENYPTRPVRMIEPFGAGGGVDTIARAVSPKLSELWGQPVTVENHPGAGSTAAPALVAKSPADGYKLLVNSSAQAYSAALLKNLPYDPLKDFIPVAPLTSQAYVLVAGKTAGVSTVGELVALAKSKPGELKFGSAGIGAGNHVGVEKFNLEAGIRAVHVPAGPGDAIADVIANTVAGRIAYMIAPIPFALPDVPAGTPAGVVEKLANDIARALAAPDLRDQLAKRGADPMSMTQPEFARFVQSESESAARIIEGAGINPR